ncbi:PepSY domain-containing protein [Metasolibacillus meyeri]|uniref:PepSY domain-containing protein n=1 Tax=Metasolibacillus meyeri TaxID=1071052 RepID=UPI001EE69FE6|nr:PepSY domain-containing protein [Metasolibacillus meyeri]
MNKKIVVLLIVTFIISYFLFSKVSDILKPQPLSKSDVQTYIEQLYTGDIKSIVMDDEEAIVSFTTKEGFYEVNVHLESGRPSNLTLVHQFVEQPVGEQPSIDEQVTEPTKQTRISEQQAIQIALKEQPGIVDNVKFKKTDDGGLYEIEIEHGDYETTFIIHAVTGKILSVQFDD